MSVHISHDILLYINFMLLFYAHIRIHFRINYILIEFSRKSTFYNRIMLYVCTYVYTVDI